MFLPCNLDNHSDLNNNNTMLTPKPTILVREIIQTWGMVLVHNNNNRHNNINDSDNNNFIPPPTNTKLLLSDNNNNNSSSLHLHLHNSSSGASLEELMKQMATNNIQFQHNVSATIQDLQTQIGQLATTIN